MDFEATTFSAAKQCATDGGVLFLPLSDYDNKILLGNVSKKFALLFETDLIVSIQKTLWMAMMRGLVPGKTQTISGSHES